jgi:hypothetical protein
MDNSQFCMIAYNLYSLITGLRESLGTHKIPVHETGKGLAGPSAADTLGQDGEVGIQEASMGEEGDFKQRAQPKIQGLEGIEFESGL